MLKEGSKLKCTTPDGKEYTIIVTGTMAAVVLSAMSKVPLPPGSDPSTPCLTADLFLDGTKVHTGYAPITWVEDDGKRVRVVQQWLAAAAGGAPPGGAGGRGATGTGPGGGGTAPAGGAGPPKPKQPPGWLHDYMKGLGGGPTGAAAPPKPPKAMPVAERLDNFFPANSKLAEKNRPPHHPSEPRNWKERAIKFFKGEGVHIPGETLQLTPEERESLAKEIKDGIQRAAFNGKLIQLEGGQGRSINFDDLTLLQKKDYVLTITYAILPGSIVDKLQSIVKGFAAMWYKQSGWEAIEESGLSDADQRKEMSNAEVVGKVVAVLLKQLGNTADLLNPVKQAWDMGKGLGVAVVNMEFDAIDIMRLIIQSKSFGDLNQAAIRLARLIPEVIEKGLIAIGMVEMIMGELAAAEVAAIRGSAGTATEAGVLGNRANAARVTEAAADSAGVNEGLIGKNTGRLSEPMGLRPPELKAPQPPPGVPPPRLDLAPKPRAAEAKPARTPERKPRAPLEDKAPPYDSKAEKEAQRRMQREREAHKAAGPYRTPEPVLPPEPYFPEPSPRPPKPAQPAPAPVLEPVGPGGPAPGPQRAPQPAPAPQPYFPEPAPKPAKPAQPALEPAQVPGAPGKAPGGQPAPQPAPVEVPKAVGEGPGGQPAKAAVAEAVEPAGAGAGQPATPGGGGSGGPGDGGGAGKPPGGGGGDPPPSGPPSEPPARRSPGVKPTWGESHFDNLYSKVDDIKGGAQWGENGRPGHPYAHYEERGIPRAQANKEILDTLNNWDKAYSGVYPTTKRPVDVYWKDGRVVITESGNKGRVITAYSERNKWATDPIYSEFSRRKDGWKGKP